MKKRKKNGAPRKRRASNAMVNASNTWLEQLQPHPKALLLPPLTEQEFAELKKGIKDDGLKVPIMVQAKTFIVDGVHRWKALGERVTLSQVQHFDGEESEVGARIISLNLHRRQLHLTDDQRVTLVAKLRGPELRAEAEARKKAGVAADLVSKTPQGRTHEQIAKEAKVSERKARRALEVVEHEPAQADKVIAGEKPLRDVKRDRRKAKRKQPPKGEVQFKDAVARARKSLVKRISREFGKSAAEVKAELVGQCVCRITNRSPDRPVAPDTMQWADEKPMAFAEVARLGGEWDEGKQKETHGEEKQ